MAFSTNEIFIVYNDHGQKHNYKIWYIKVKQFLYVNFISVQYPIIHLDYGIVFEYYIII